MGAGIQLMSLFGCTQEDAALVLYVGYSEDSPSLFYEPAWEKASVRRKPNRVKCQE